MDGIAEGSVDRGRSAVYAAEDQWSRQVDRGGTVNFYGSHLTLAKQLTFDTLEGAQAYVVSVCGQLRERGRDVRPPIVRARKGAKAAHYERKTQTIAVPLDVTWALRESVLLHELAHHVMDPQAPAHGELFRSTMLDLVSLVMGAESATLLAAAYRGVQLP